MVKGRFKFSEREVHDKDRGKAFMFSYPGFGSDGVNYFPSLSVLLPSFSFPFLSSPLKLSSSQPMRFLFFPILSPIPLQGKEGEAVGSELRLG